jgi:transcriptional regulator with XRE-family HTH domain
MPFAWRKRLREAVGHSWMKREAIARKAGTTQETLSRILTGRIPTPGFELVVRITHAAGESVGWILGEYGYSLSEEERGRLRDAAAAIINATAAGHLLRKDAPARTRAKARYD